MVFLRRNMWPENVTTDGHAWIECDGLIIDLAAGQFPDAPERVMITRDSSWHAQFKEQRRHPADIGLYDENTRKCLLDAYDQIISNLVTVESG
jgi:hypothetical protein